jgi:4-carboxymuconolactone decarboxylase
VHYPLAIKGGVDPKILSDIAAGKRPEGMKDDQRAAAAGVAEIGFVE